MNKHFGDKLKELRVKSGLTQSELAEKSGVTVASLSRWENGTRSPRQIDVEKITSALGVSVSYLMGETDDPKRFTTILGEAGNFWEKIRDPEPPVAEKNSFIIIELKDGVKFSLPATANSYEFIRQFYFELNQPVSPEKRAVLKMMEEMSTEEIREMYEFLSTKKSKNLGA